MYYSEAPQNDLSGSLVEATTNMVRRGFQAAWQMFEAPEYPCLPSTDSSGEITDKHTGVSWATDVPAGRLDVTVDVPTLAIPTTPDHSDTQLAIRPSQPLEIGGESLKFLCCQLRIRDSKSPIEFTPQIPVTAVLRDFLTLVDVSGEQALRLKITDMMAGTAIRAWHNASYFRHVKDKTRDDQTVLHIMRSYNMARGPQIKHHLTICKGLLRFTAAIENLTATEPRLSQLSYTSTGETTQPIDPSLNERFTWRKLRAANSIGRSILEQAASLPDRLQL
jgi:hypothetical protein